MTVVFLGVGAPSARASASMEQRFIALINGERAERDLRTLVAAVDVTSVARSHSDEMARAGRIWHTEGLQDKVRNWDLLGENVGMGPTVDSLHTAFMRSDVHRQNILMRAYDHVGVGVAVRDETIYVTVIFLARSSGTGSGSVAPAVPSRASAAPSRVAVRPAPTPSSRTLAVLERLRAGSSVAPPRVRRTIPRAGVGEEAPSGGTVLIVAVIASLLGLIAVRRRWEQTPPLSPTPSDRMLLGWVRWQDRSASLRTLAIKERRSLSRTPSVPAEIGLGLGWYIRMDADLRDGEVGEGPSDLRIRRGPEEAETSLRPEGPADGSVALRRRSRRRRVIPGAR